MKNAFRALAFLIMLLPGVAAAQCNSSTPLPINTVLGRLGITPGPCQAIPFSRLLALIGGTTAMPTGYWAKLTHSNNVGTPNTKIDIGAGSCRDSTDTINIINIAGTIDTGVVGANGLDAGVLALSTKYYTFAITTAAGGTAFLASLSATAPTLPVTYTKFRRIGFFKTDASVHIMTFKHVNNRWRWSPKSIRDVNVTASNNTSTAATLSVPNVPGVIAKIAVAGFPGTAVAASVYVHPTSIGAITGSTGGAILTYATTNGNDAITDIEVDSSAQINFYVAAASGVHTFVIDTLGWQDDL